jgi:hypothetical protein
MRHWFGTQRRTSSLLPVHAALHAYLIDQGQTIIDEAASPDRASTRTQQKPPSARQNLPLAPR